MLVPVKISVSKNVMEIKNKNKRTGTDVVRFRQDCEIIGENGEINVPFQLITFSREDVYESGLFSCHLDIVAARFGGLEAKIVTAHAIKKL